MLLFSNQVEFTVCVSQCARTVGTNRRFCASLHQAPCGRPTLALLTAWPTYHCFALGRVRLEEQRRSEGEATEELWRSCGRAQEEQKKLWSSSRGGGQDELWRSSGGAGSLSHWRSLTSTPPVAFLTSFQCLWDTLTWIKGTFQGVNLIKSKSGISISLLFLHVSILRWHVQPTGTESEDAWRQGAQMEGSCKQRLVFFHWELAAVDSRRVSEGERGGGEAGLQPRDLVWWNQTGWKAELEREDTQFTIQPRERWVAEPRLFSSIHPTS